MVQFSKSARFTSPQHFGSGGWGWLGLLLAANLLTLVERGVQSANWTAHDRLVALVQTAALGTSAVLLLILWRCRQALAQQKTGSSRKQREVAAARVAETASKELVQEESSGGIPCALRQGLELRLPAR